MGVMEKYKDEMEYDIVSSIENLYYNHSIYRTIIVCPDNFLDMYKSQLEQHDHNVYVLSEYEAIDYDVIDTRIFIITESNFINFIKKYDDNLFYNVIFFTSQKNKETLISEYKSIIKSDNIII